MPKTIDHSWQGWYLYLYIQWFANKKAGMKITHEEEDVIIPQQVQKVMDDGHKNVKVIFDDTNATILLLHFTTVLLLLSKNELAK